MLAPARAGVKVASHVRPVIAGSRDERPAALRHPRLRRAAARGRLPLAARDGRLPPSSCTGAPSVIDTHSDCTQRIAYDGIDFARAQPDMHVDLPKMRAGGLDAEFSPSSSVPGGRSPRATTPRR